MLAESGMSYPDIQRLYPRIRVDRAVHQRPDTSRKSTMTGTAVRGCPLLERDHARPTQSHRLCLQRVVVDVGPPSLCQQLVFGDHHIERRAEPRAASIGTTTLYPRIVASIGVYTAQLPANSAMTRVVIP